LPQPPAHNPIGMPIIELQSVDSTNNYARSLLYEGLAQHGTAIFAHEQLAGKGQRGKVWVSEKDANIILSVVVNPEPLQLLQQFQLSACMALAISEFLIKYAGKDTKIKWPNDLYWQDRKAGGILIESGVGSQEWPTDNRQWAMGNKQPAISNQQPATSNWQWAIVGIGININQTHFPPGLANPVSLRQITGKNFDPLVLAKELCVILDNYFQQLVTKGFDAIYSQYLGHLYKKKEPVRWKKGSRVFEATLKTILPTGKLVVQHSIEEEFDFGEVEWVI
jgi:BirA family transcriptional regulator, biotin operon repressor / biotin---[acetyl-CoA-carboxylase] ligase